MYFSPILSFPLSSSYFILCMAPNLTLELIAFFSLLLLYACVCVCVCLYAQTQPTVAIFIVCIYVVLGLTAFLLGNSSRDSSLAEVILPLSRH